MPISDIPPASLREALGLAPADEDEDLSLDQWLGSVTDVNGQILAVSARFCQRLGFREAEVVGRDHRIFSSNLHERPFFEHLWKTILAGEEWSGVIVNRHHDGTLRPFETTIRPIWSPDRQLLGFASVRLALDEGHALIDGYSWLPRHVLEQVADGVMIVDAQHPDEGVLYVNPAWCRLTGYHRDEVIGRNPRFLQGAGTNRSALAEMSEALRAGKHAECEVINYRRNGTPFWNRLRVSPVVSPTGEILHYTAIVFDATEHRAGRLMLDLEKTALAQVVQERPLAEIFRTLLGRVGEFIPHDSAAILLVDSAGTRLRLAAEQALPPNLREALEGTPAEEPADIFSHFEKPEESWLEVSIDQAAAGGAGSDAFRRFLEAQRAAGLKASWAVTSAGADGSLEAYMVLHFAEKRTATAKEKDYLRMMAHLISVALGRGHSRRLRETIDRKLRQSQRMEAIGTLAGGIAHDFNNILGGLFGFLHLATEDIGPDHPAQEWLREIDGACKRARDLVQQVLTFSRSESAARVPINLASVTKDAAHLVRASLPSSVKVEIVPAGKVLPEILGDPTQLQLAILNLCTNAWQAMENGAGRIELRLATTVDETGQSVVQLSIEDDGEGIEADSVERIFDPFYSTRPTGGGTGLGLSVVHGIVKAHGGQVVVESVPEQGSIFHLQFPVTQRPEESSVVGADETPRGKGEHVLFIDDERAIVTWSRLILERMGYVVTAFTDPELALIHLQAHLEEVDLVVTDLTMPGVSGGEVIRQAREWRPDLPIILISGRGIVLTPEEREGFGAVELLYKPIGMADLGQTLRRVLDRDP